MHEQTSKHALAMIACTVGACSDAPAPPPQPTAVLQLAPHYDNPTASMDSASARRVLDRASELTSDLQPYTGLFFLRAVIEDATAATATETELPVELQGSLLVQSPCPGWTAAVEPDPADGYIELAIGIKDSQAQRAFAGSFEGCHFVAGDIAASLSAQLEIDFGTTLGLGEPVPPLLVRVTSVTLAYAVDARVLEVPELHFRLGEAGRLERLVELDELGLGVFGSAVVALNADGTLGLRTREGEWACGPDRSQPCALLP